MVYYAIMKLIIWIFKGKRENYPVRYLWETDGSKSHSECVWIFIREFYQMVGKVQWSTSRGEAGIKKQLRAADYRTGQGFHMMIGSPVDPCLSSCIPRSQ
jgi:hypothetical protein